MVTYRVPTTSTSVVHSSSEFGGFWCELPPLLSTTTKAASPIVGNILVAAGICSRYRAGLDMLSVPPPRVTP